MVESLSLTLPSIYEQHCWLIKVWPLTTGLQPRMQTGTVHSQQQQEYQGCLNAAHHEWLQEQVLTWRRGGCAAGCPDSWQGCAATSPAACACAEAPPGHHGPLHSPNTRCFSCACNQLQACIRGHRTGADAWSPTFLAAHAAATVPCCIERRSSSMLSSHASAACKLGRGIASTVRHHIGTLGGIRPRTGPRKVTWARPGPSCRQGAHQW